MGNRRRPWVATGSVLGTALLLACGGTGAAWSEDSEVEMSGIVTAVGGAALPNTITIQNGGASVTVTCTAETEFEVDDDTTTVTDLSGLVGFFAEVEYNPTTMVAEEVEIENEFKIFGEVVRVEGTAFPYTVAIRPFSGPEVVLTVTAETELETEDEGAIPNLAALVGHFVKAEYNGITNVASEIESEDEDEYVVGVLVSMDTTAGSFVVKTRRGEVTFFVDEECDLFLDFQETDLADLVIGSPVLVKFESEDGGPNIAEKVCVLTPRPAVATGTLTEVSETGGFCSLRADRLHPRVAAVGSRPVPELVKVNAGTLVLLDGRRVSLASLPPGCRVHVKYVTRDGLTVARRLSATTPPTVPISGTLTAIRPTATTAAKWRTITGPQVGTLELTLRGGQKVTVVIHAETRIKINGRPATSLEELALNSRCHVLCLPLLEGVNEDGSDKVSFHAYRVSARKPAPTTSP